MDWHKSLRDTGNPRSKVLVGKTKSLSTALTDYTPSGSPFGHGPIDNNSVCATPPRRTPPPYRQQSRNSRDESETPPSRGRAAKRPGMFTPPAKIREDSAWTSPPGSPRTTSISVDGDDMSEITEVDSEEGDNVQVLVRVRPTNEAELQDGAHQPCVNIMGTRNILLSARGRPEPYVFKFDQVLPDTTEQDEVFDMVGMPIVENCINGFNSTIFAYGQTGSGKTYTMLGAIQNSADSRRGLVPRVFEFLFQRVAEQEDQQGRDTVRYSCRCSFLEIYNETITDLLNPSATNLQIREGDKRGPYVEGLTEEIVLNVDEVLELLRRGAENRHVGATLMNRESSRSHSVFTCTVERSTKSSSGLTNVLFSRLNLIDLAGSERQKQSGAQGGHLKEACHINKSLTILGRVIMELVETQRSGKTRHVPYRDSRLTFLLQDSLGGNAKTMIIANVSPSAVNASETLSTLQFAKRAKFIRNRPEQNQETTGQVSALQREIARLNKEIFTFRQGNSEELSSERDALRRQLQEEEAQRQEMQLRMDQLQAENSRYKRERDRLDAKLTRFQSDRRTLNHTVDELQDDMEACLDNMQQEGARQASIIEVLEQQVGLLTSQLAAVSEAGATAEREATQGAARAAKLQQQLAVAQAAKQQVQEVLEAARKEADDLEEELKKERSQGMVNTKQLQAKLQQQRQEYAQLHSDFVALQQQIDEAEDQLQGERASLKVATVNSQLLEKDLSTARGKLQQQEEHAAKLQEELSATRAKLQLHEGVTAGLESKLSDTCSELEQQRALAAELGQKLAAAVAAADAAAEAAAEQQRVLSSQLQGTEGEVQKRAAELAALCEQLQGQATRAEAAEKLVEELRAAVQHLQECEAALAEELEGERAGRAADAAKAAVAAEEAAAEAARQLARESGLRELRDEAVIRLTADVERVQAELAAEASTRAEVERQLATAKQAMTLAGEEAVRKLEEAMETLQTEQGAHTATAGKLAGTLEKLSASEELAAATAERLAASEELARATADKLNAAEALAAATAEQLAAAEEQLEASKREVARLQAAYGNEVAGSEVLRQELSDTQEHLEAVQAQLECVAVELAAEKDTAAQLKDQLDGLRQAHSELGLKEEEVEGVLGRVRGELAASVRRVAELEAELAQLKEALGGREADLQGVRGELAARVVELEGVREELAAKLKVLEQAEASLEETRREVEELKAELGRRVEELQGVQGDLGERDEELQGVQALLEAAKGAAADRAAEVERLQEELGAAEKREEQLQGQACALDQGLREAKEECGRRRQQEEELAAQVVTLREAVEGALGEVEQLKELREEALAQLRLEEQRRTDDVQQLKSTLDKATRDAEERLEALQQSKDVLEMELQQQLEDLQTKLSAEEACRAETQAELESSGRECGRLQDALAAAQAQAEGRGTELDAAVKQVESLKQELAQITESLEQEQATLGGSKQEVAELKKQAETEAARASKAHKEQERRIHDLQKELIKAQEKLVRAEVNTKQQVQHLTQQLDEATTKLAAARAELEAEQSDHLQDKEVMEQLERDVADMQKAMTDAVSSADQEHRRLIDRIAAANQEVAHLKERLSDSESQIKDELVRSARQGRAFQEIRRLIDWAVTPSTPSKHTPAHSPSLRANSVDRFRVSQDFPEPLHPLKGATTPRGAAVAEVQLVPPPLDLSDVPLMQLPSRLSQDRRHPHDQNLASKSYGSSRPPLSPIGNLT